MWLFTSRDNRGDNRLYDHNRSDNRIQVRVVRLDELLPQMGVAELNFIKIDVQGFEGEVLAGLEETIRRSPKLQILMEFWPEGLRSAGTDPAELLRRLEVIRRQNLQRIHALRRSQRGNHHRSEEGAIQTVYPTPE